MRKHPSEYASIQSLLDNDGMSNGAHGVKGTIDWWRKEDDRPIIKVTISAIDRLAQCEEDLCQQSRSIKSQLSQMETSLEAGHHINSVGVLQRCGVELDMLCARRQALIDEIKTLLWVIKKDHQRSVAG